MQYAYDQLGRLISAATAGEGGWGLAWNYDGFGNLYQQSVTKGTAPSFSIGVSGATNRAGGTHDANGNLLSGAGISNSYDVDNRLTATSRTGHSAGYRYSARNERIVVYKNGARQFHFYGVDGLLLGVYTAASEGNPHPVRVDARQRVYFHGRLPTIGGEWVATDRLGSVVRKGSTNYNYAPYGQEIGGATENNTAKFATYTRDTASGYDYALNRYYNSQWGRFTSPDPSDLNIRYGVPGSWNVYAYSDGDPINMNDPAGLGFWSWLGKAFKTVGTAVGQGVSALISVGGQDVAAADEGATERDDGDAGGGGSEAQGVVTSTITYPPVFISIAVPIGATYAGIPITLYANQQSGQFCAAIGFEMSSSPVNFNVMPGALITQLNSNTTDQIMNGFGWSAGAALSPVGYQVFWGSETGTVAGPTVSPNPARAISIFYSYTVWCRNP